MKHNDPNKSDYHFIYYMCKQIHGGYLNCYNIIIYVLYLEALQKLEEEKAHLAAEVSELKKYKNDAETLGLQVKSIFSDWISTYRSLTVYRLIVLMSSHVNLSSL